MNYRLSIRLVDENGEKFFGEGVAALLENIQLEGSLNLAAKRMDLAYSKAWKILHRAESTLGFELVMKKSGGVHGGGSVLTNQGESFLRQYREFEAEVRKSTQEIYKQIFEL